MSVVSWDSIDNQNVQLNEKQLESVYVLSLLDCNMDLDIACSLDDKKSDVDVRKTEKSMQLASHFYTWLWSLEQTCDSEVSQKFVTLKKSECHKIMTTIDEILSNLKLLKQNYLSISQKTNELHELCEHLLQQQELSTINFIASREKLLPILDKLDSSISYFQENIHFQVASIYLTKARSVLLKALNFVKDNVIKIIERTINELMELHDVITPDNSFILLYGRFRTQGKKIRSIISLLEERVHITDEYIQVITECHTFYLKNREELLTPVVTNSINDLVKTYSNDHCALLRTAGAFMINMCEDEMRLFNQFFSTQFSSTIIQMLSRLCQCLYDAVRPLIIHINHFEILCELCDIIKSELIEEHSVDGRPDIRAFSKLCDMLLADVQERLIFRSHIYMKSQILGYAPSSGDLAYPEKLEMMDNISKSVIKQSDSPSTADGSSLQVNSIEPQLETLTKDARDISITPGPNMSLAPADLHGMWYPTVRRTLVCLSKLSRCLDANSFRGLAQECVSVCVQSLVQAYELISQRKCPLDGQLFIIKHLLILREQLAPFNVEFLVNETSLDFSTYKNMALNMWQEKGLGLFVLNRNNALLRFLLETPNAIDVEVDSRRQLDGQLKYICELLIEQQVYELTGELSSFSKRASMVLSAPGAKLSDQGFAKVPVIKETVAESHRHLCIALGRKSGKQSDSSKHIPNLSHSLRIYLGNPDTQNILLRRIQSGVVQCWKSVYKLLLDHYTDEDRMIIACPNESQIRLLFQDLWTEGST